MENEAAAVAESTPTPQVVGNAFVEQYYTLLAQSPENVYKFYQDSSVISRPTFDGLMSSASNLESINKMILSLGYKNYGVEILTTDAQESVSDGVIVLVTGILTGKDINRKFTQVFFLAPQPHNSHAYYVLNDVLRYVDEKVASTTEIDDADDANATPVTVTPVPEASPVTDHAEAENTVPPLEEPVEAEEPSHTLDNGKISVVEEVVSSHSVEAEEPNTLNDGPVSAVAGDSDSHQVPESTISTIPEDVPKKSYASVANALNYKKQPFQQRILPAKPVEQMRATVAPEPSPRPVNNTKPVEKNNNTSSSVKGYSIFVANLPMNATVQDLIDTFSKYGPIKPNGVQVRSYKQEKNCFGFVEFESASSMQSALEASPIKIGEREAHIEEKKANNEGGKFAPRKGGFRGDSFRNRGNFGGGRGYGRNESDNQGGVSGQSRGSGRRNGEANQKVYQNGGGRGPRQTQTEPQTETQGGNN